MDIEQSFQPLVEAWVETPDLDELEADRFLAAVRGWLALRVDSKPAETVAEVLATLSSAGHPVVRWSGLLELLRWLNPVFNMDCRAVGECCPPAGFARFQYDLPLPEVYADDPEELERIRVVYREALFEDILPTISGWWNVVGLLVDALPSADQARNEPGAGEARICALALCTKILFSASEVTFDDPDDAAIQTLRGSGTTLRTRPQQHGNPPAGLGRRLVALLLAKLDEFRPPGLSGGLLFAEFCLPVRWIEERTQRRPHRPITPLFYECAQEVWDWISPSTSENWSALRDARWTDIETFLARGDVSRRAPDSGIRDAAATVLYRLGRERRAWSHEGVQALLRALQAPYLAADLAIRQQPADTSVVVRHVKEGLARLGPAGPGGLRKILDPSLPRAFEDGDRPSYLQIDEDWLLDPVTAGALCFEAGELDEAEELYLLRFPTVLKRRTRFAVEIAEEHRVRLFRGLMVEELAVPFVTAMLNKWGMGYAGRLGIGNTEHTSTERSFGGIYSCADPESAAAYARGQGLIVEFVEDIRDVRIDWRDLRRQLNAAEELAPEAQEVFGDEFVRAWRKRRESEANPDYRWTVLSEPEVVRGFMRNHTFLNLFGWATRTCFASPEPVLPQQIVSIRPAGPYTRPPTRQLAVEERDGVRVMVVGPEEGH